MSEPVNIEDVKAALEPFARLADNFDHLDDESIILVGNESDGYFELFVRPFRKARAMITAAERSDNG